MKLSNLVICLAAAILAVISTRADSALRVLGHRYAEEMRRLSQAEPVELPPLFGDGVHDDTAAIQARLDAGSSCVYLPPPAKEYLVSTTLVVRSGTELRLPRTARVRLAHGSCVEMITNGDWEEGAHDIVVSGGIWDYDNAHQSPNPYVTRPPDAFPKTFTPGYDYGALMRFVNVTRLRLEGMTMRNPTAYNCHLCAVRFFTVDDITFEADNWRPYPINNDGINVTGGSHHGRISNLRGYCSDDMVAINANKSKLKPACAVGPIFDIDIDGLYSDYTHRGVRIYSIGERVERITVRNVHIRTYRNAVAITHFQPGRPRGKFDSIVIRDIFASTAYEPETICHDRVAWPLVWVENDCDVGHLVIENVCRTETGCAYMPTVGIDPKATVENLVIRDCRQVNETKDDLVFLVNRGKVANLELGSVSLKSAPGAGRSILRDDKGATGFEMGNRKWTPNVRPKGK